MATINTHTAKDGSKSYKVRIRRKGQPVQTASFSSLREARHWATIREGEILAGRHFPEKKPKHTLSELLDRYVHDIMPHKTPETQRSQRPVIVFWRERLGHKLLQDITKADVIGLRNEIAETSAPATIQKYLVILSHALNIAIKEYEWLDTNVVNTVSKPSLPQGRLRFLSDEERSRLLDECRRSQNKHLYPHSTASYLVQAGIPLYTVGTILNHKNPALMTYRYAHLQTDHLRDALKTLADRIAYKEVKG
jgi:integrase